MFGNSTAAAQVSGDYQIQLEPIRRLADALGAEGRSGSADDRRIFTGVALNPERGTVDLYLTSVEDAGAFIASAVQRDRSIDVKRITVHASRYSRLALEAARAELDAASLSQSLPYTINSASLSVDGSGLILRVDDPAFARGTIYNHSARLKGLSAAQLAGNVPLSFVYGSRVTPVSWADYRWHDSQPFIAGDTLIGFSAAAYNTAVYCTAGIPAVGADGSRFLVTARHCYPSQTYVYTAGGTTGNYDYNSTGNYVGQTKDDSNLDAVWDAEKIVGTDNNADEGDSSGYKPLTRYAYSYNGDSVCQDGQGSFFAGHSVPCGIKVLNDNTTYSFTDWSGKHTMKGVYGCNPGGGWAVNDGDSGGAVFALFDSSNNRELRGIVSSSTGTAVSGGGRPCLFWTEATDILHAFNATLNPVR